MIFARFSNEKPLTRTGEVTAIIDTGTVEQLVFFHSTDTTLAASGETLLASALFGAMREGQVCIVEDSVSPRFLRGTQKAQEILSFWWAELSQVSIRVASSCTNEFSGVGRVGTFFTGGMDSFYTLLKHRDEITDLIFVHGFDVRLEDRDLRRRISEMIAKVGARFGKRTIEIETNLRQVLEPWGSWEFTHGVALASIAHLLSNEFVRIYIPATHTYKDLMPWGSHPLLDPLWSTETLEIVHDGCEATRVQKAARVADSEVALESLRVCWRNPGGAYNCSRCEKCIRTMINLQSVGALDRCTTFAKLDLRDIKRITHVNDNTRAFIKENLVALEAGRQSPDISRALRRVLRRESVLARLRSLPLVRYLKYRNTSSSNRSAAQ